MVKFILGFILGFIIGIILFVLFQIFINNSYERKMAEWRK